MELVQQRDYLEAQLEDALTYSDELETIWENNEIAIAKKIDAYGFVIDDLKSKSEFLANKKRKLTELKTSLDNEIDRIKGRIAHHANGEKLVGNEYKFHPFISKTNTVDISQVEDEYLTYTLPKLDFSEYDTLLTVLGDSTLGRKLQDRATTSCNVSDLPEGHKALVTSIKPSVRIT